MSDMSIPTSDVKPGDLDGSMEGLEDQLDELMNGLSDKVRLKRWMELTRSGHHSPVFLRKVSRPFNIRPSSRLWQPARFRYNRAVRWDGRRASPDK
jgi:hypothetical protein